ncbi:hypothetical protein BDQ17DRAFT_1397732 [Cyathus striatus]|nr:hypothetical protein BDQ17DRAFT_1397732 [Cyathus striatus]
MQSESALPPSPQLCQRFQSLVWSCLDSDLTKSAVFHAERLYAIDTQNHESRHLYATALFREGQVCSALSLVTRSVVAQCTGCLEIKAKCCTALGRHREAREALEATLRDSIYVSGASTSSRASRTFPDEASLKCRSGNMALKGNLPDRATRSFREALSLNPHLWEAFEGLCALGPVPEIDDLFPPNPLQESQAKQGPIVTGAGFFTPEAGTATNLFRWKPDAPQAQPFRMGPLPGPKDSLAANDSFYPDNSFQHRPTRSHAGNAGATQAYVTRPLSSADEAGPKPKRLRSTTRQPEVVKSMKPNSKSINDDNPKKARARPALSFANIFSSSGRSSQTLTSSRTAPGLGKSNAQPTVSNIPTRRSTRLLSGTGVKPPSKQNPIRRRQVTHGHKRSTTESDKDEEPLLPGELVYPPSPPSAALSPHSEASPSPSNWTSVQEQLAQEEYESDLADYYIYDLIRKFASATRALAMYDCQKCLDELEQLPHVHQNTPWVLAMVGRAHYEKQDYASAERAFKAVRQMEPHRLWDMEVYSTLLWHLQNSVELSYLAQELLNISPQSPQAWIAIGNLFSLQKDRVQALTCFRRAAQLDPGCAYAYTLSGHESIDEDLDKATNFFQSALRADPRHYNAWYGLGTCYLRMSKVRLAEYHYRKAMEIHPKNAVLLGCVGMAVERRGERENALALFDEAVKLAPDNALVRYRRAKILVALRKYEEAVKDLLFLRNATPEESNVVFQLAKVYRLLGNEVESARTLAIARDISPKSINKIKKLLETVKDEGGDDRMDEG